MEDEGLVAADIELCLQSMGNSAISASSGESALEIASRIPFDLALLDIHLAGRLDGIATALELKRRFNLNVVFLTAHADGATLARAQQANPFGYLLKPFREQDLCVSIEMLAHQLRDKPKKPEGQETLLSELLEQMRRRKEDIEGAIRAIERVGAEPSSPGLLVRRKRGRPPGSRNRVISSSQ